MGIDKSKRVKQGKEIIDTEKKPANKEKCLILARFLYGIYQKQKALKNEIKIVK
jgi:hypothetical protein